MSQTQNEFVKIGVIKDAHSLKGEVFVRLFAGKADWLDDVEELQITPRSGEVLSLFIDGYRKHKDGLIVKFEGFNDRTQAETLKGSTVEIPAEVLVADSGETPYLREVLGFLVIDQNQKVIGKVTDFATNGRQDILVVVSEDKSEVLIPFIKEFVTEMDMTGQKIHMDLPLGLVEVNQKGGGAEIIEKDEIEDAEEVESNDPSRGESE